jgi:hypothetical protein
MNRRKIDKAKKRLGLAETETQDPVSVFIADQIRPPKITIIFETRNANAAAAMLQRLVDAMAKGESS